MAFNLESAAKPGVKNIDRVTATALTHVLILQKPVLNV